MKSDHYDFFTWLLNNIYLNFGENIINENDIKYDEIYIYRV